MAGIKQIMIYYKDLLEATEKQLPTGRSLDYTFGKPYEANFVMPQAKKSPFLNNDLGFTAAFSNTHKNGTPYKRNSESCGHAL